MPRFPCIQHLQCTRVSFNHEHAQIGFNPSHVHHTRRSASTFRPCQAIGFSRKSDIKVVQEFKCVLQVTANPGIQIHDDCPLIRGCTKRLYDFPRFPHICRLLRFGQSHQSYSWNLESRLISENHNWCRRRVPLHRLNCTLELIEIVSNALCICGESYALVPRRRRSVHSDCKDYAGGGPSTSMWPQSVVNINVGVTLRWCRATCGLIRVPLFHHTICRQNRNFIPSGNKSWSQVSVHNLASACTGMQHNDLTHYKQRYCRTVKAAIVLNRQRKESDI